MTTPSTVRLEICDGVGTVTLNRPERRNAISWQLVIDLIASLESARSNDDVRVVVITGAGRDFCVGADMARVGSDRPSDQETRTLRGRSVEDDLERLTHASTAAELLVTFPKPTIAAVDGACAGAGLSLALATDVRIASERAVFNTAFVSAGVSGDFGSAWLLARAVGPARASSMLLDPVKMSAAEAGSSGLVTEVAPDLSRRVNALATRLAGQASQAMTHAKQNLLDAGSQTFADYIRREVPRMVDCARSGDAHEAARAYLEKRKPVFTGE